MNTKTLKLPAQALNIFFKAQEDENGKVIGHTLNGDFRSIPSNPEGATRAYFTGLDITPEAKAKIKALAKSAKDKNGQGYLALGTVEATVEVVAVRQPQPTDQNPEVAFRVKVIDLDRATDTNTDELVQLLG